ncbi:MAG: penicillin acylase family protein [Verrucomicrobia bacterium]|nr:penicillin acylase family protein [Verrucomicrobiota bacterium]
MRPRQLRLEKSAVAFVASLTGLSLAFDSLTASGATDAVTLAGLGDGVRVCFDRHDIPHIYAKSWPDAARVLGYLHAGERLWQMDLFCRQGSGTVAEILGPDALESDILVRQLGIRRGCEALWNSSDVPAALRAELIAYAEGVNARVAELGEKGLPAPFQKLGYQPAPWTPVDTLVFTKYMGWDQSGTLDDLWFCLMVEKLGVTAVEELWPIDRPYETPAVKAQVDRRKYAVASPLAPVPGAAPACAAALRRYGKLRWLGRGGSFGSNNWAVDGTKTDSGKPMLCSDPHLGFSLPMIWYACHTCVNGENLVGVTFPGGPGFIIGHNDELGWGLTNLQADAVDLFVETINPADAMQYQHRGEWKRIHRVTEQVAVRGEPARILNVDSTVHGPIISREGRTISLQWTGLGPTKDLVALWRVSHAKNLKQLLNALDDLTVPAMNVIYADRAGNIAMHPCGALPIRLRGQGRIPMDGASGDHDWTGMIPRSGLPLAINPPDHFVASANARPTPLDYPHYLGWMWDCSYRVRRIHDLLGPARKLTVETMKPIQLDAYDKAAERFLPMLLQDLKAADFNDPLAKRAAREVENWNYVADTRALGPAIWLRWFDIYRGQVWDDEWKSRGIEQPRGSWGFSGSNQREPELEVLEYLTREFPTSIWFDDRSTPARESRADIARRSFDLALASLRKQFGDDVEKWRWGNINELKVRSLTQQPELSRNGGPTVGTEFTVNPGSNVGPVGGGASWRMIVDFGHLDQSVGIYPGGQSENPDSPFYDDQMKLWAKGQYVPLYMVGNPQKLPPQAKVKVISFRRL